MDVVRVVDISIAHGRLDRADDAVDMSLAANLFRCHRRAKRDADRQPLAGKRRTLGLAPREHEIVRTENALGPAGQHARNALQDSGSDVWSRSLIKVAKAKVK